MAKVVFEASSFGALGGDRQGRNCCCWHCCGRCEHQTLWYVSALDGSVNTCASSAFNWLTSGRQFAEHFTRREFLSAVHAGAFHLLLAEECVWCGGSGWCDLWCVVLWASAGLVLDGDVSLGDALWKLHEVKAGHIGWRIAWKVADDGLLAQTGVDLCDLWWRNHCAFAYATTLGIDHSWNVVLSAGLFAGYGGLKSVLCAQEMVDTSALVLDLLGFVQVEEGSRNWFVASTFGGLDAGSVDVLNEPVDALAAFAAGLSGWALEVLHRLCLAGLGTLALGWHLSTSAELLCSCGWYGDWKWFANWATFARNHNFFLGVWIADFAGLWFFNKLVVNTDVFVTGLRRWLGLSWLEDDWRVWFLGVGHEALAVGRLDAGYSVEDEVSRAVASRVTLFALDAVWFKEVTHAACLHARCEHEWCGTGHLSSCWHLGCGCCNIFNSLEVNALAASLIVKLYLHLCL